MHQTSDMQKINLNFERSMYVERESINVATFQNNTRTGTNITCLLREAVRKKTADFEDIVLIRETTYPPSPIRT